MNLDSFEAMFDGPHLDDESLHRSESAGRYADDPAYRPIPEIASTAAESKRSHCTVDGRYEGRRCAWFATTQVEPGARARLLMDDLVASGVLRCYVAVIHEPETGTRHRHYHFFLDFFVPIGKMAVLEMVFSMNHEEKREVKLEYVKSRKGSVKYITNPEKMAAGARHVVGPWYGGELLDDESVRRNEPASQNPKPKQMNLVDAFAAIRKGVTVAQLIDENPALAYKRKQLAEYRADHMQKKILAGGAKDVTVRVFYGRTGCGKSVLAAHEAAYFCEGNEAEVFQLNDPGAGDTGTVWFNGYDYGRILIIEEFKCWIPISVLLLLLDKHPRTKIGSKGEMLTKGWTEVWITTNVPFWDWTDVKKRPMLPEHRTALWRRISWYVEFRSMSEFKVLRCPLCKKADDARMIPEGGYPIFGPGAIQQQREQAEREAERRRLLPPEPPKSGSSSSSSSSDDGIYTVPTRKEAKCPHRENHVRNKFNFLTVAVRECDEYEPVEPIPEESREAKRIREFEDAFALAAAASGSVKEEPIEIKDEEDAI